MLQFCAQHKTELDAALAMRDLNRFNITNAQSREDAHIQSLDSLADKTVVDPVRTAQAMILQRAVQTRPDLIFKRGAFCPCCVANEDFLKMISADPEHEDRDAIPFGDQLIIDASKAIEDDLKARGLIK